MGSKAYFLSIMEGQSYKNVQMTRVQGGEKQLNDTASQMCLKHLLFLLL